MSHTKIKSVEIKTIAICHSNEKFIDHLRGRLAKLIGVERVLKFADVDDLIRVASQTQFDLVLVEVNEQTKDPSSLISDIVLAAPEVTVLVILEARSTISLVTEDEIENLLTQTAHAGAAGYIRQDIRNNELLALYAAISGIGIHPSRKPVKSQISLSPREQDMLRGFCEGKTKAQIGADLYISEDTVKTHCKRLFLKLGVHNRSAAVLAAYRNGLLDMSVP
jgi:DNA-binding NarL/FixJ family response regulator